MIISSFFILTFGCRNKSNYNNLDQSENHNNVLKIDKYEVENIGKIDSSTWAAFSLDNYELFIPKKWGEPIGYVEDDILYSIFLDSLNENVFFQVKYYDLAKFDYSLESYNKESYLSGLADTSEKITSFQYAELFYPDRTYLHLN